MKIKSIILGCFMVLLTFFVGCSPSENKRPVSASYIAGESLTDQSLVRWIGRTEYSSAEKKVYTYYTATGFTVNFYGTELYVTYHATNTGSVINRPYFVCMVDGESAEDATTFCLTKVSQTVKVISSLPEGKHTATVLMRSEPENSLVSVSEIFTDGKFLPPTQHTGLKFQIIGSSGISGHGCLGSTGQPWTTENSSSLNSFAYLAAQEFGAECQFVSASGMGMVWSASRLGGLTMQQAYEATGLIASYNSDGSTKKVSAHGTWNHSKWVPDVVIANIGGNDWTVKQINKLSGDEKIEAQNTFKNAVIALLTRIHTLYPNAKIVWSCNSTSSGNGEQAYNAIQTLSFKNSIITLSTGTMTEGGADDHAGLSKHQEVAAAVIDAIIENFGFQPI